MGREEPLSPPHPLNVDPLTKEEGRPFSGPKLKEVLNSTAAGRRCSDSKALILIVWCNIRVTTFKQCDPRHMRRSYCRDTE